MLPRRRYILKGKDRFVDEEWESTSVSKYRYQGWVDDRGMRRISRNLIWRLGVLADHLTGFLTFGRLRIYDRLTSSCDRPYIDIFIPSFWLRHGSKLNSISCRVVLGASSEVLSHLRRIPVRLIHPIRSPLSFSASEKGYNGFWNPGDCDRSNMYSISLDWSRYRWSIRRICCENILQTHSLYPQCFGESHFYCCLVHSFLLKYRHWQTSSSFHRSCRLRRQLQESTQSYHGRIESCSLALTPSTGITSHLDGLNQISTAKKKYRRQS